MPSHIHDEWNIVDCDIKQHETSKILVVDCKSWTVNLCLLQMRWRSNRGIPREIKPDPPSTKQCCMGPFIYDVIISKFTIRCNVWYFAMRQFPLFLFNEGHLDNDYIPPPNESSMMWSVNSYKLCTLDLLPWQPQWRQPGHDVSFTLRGQIKRSGWPMASKV